MKNRATVVTVIALLAVIGMIGTGCERTAEAPTVDVTGTWKGNGYMGPTDQRMPTTLVLKQSGADVTGTWNGLPAQGTVSGNKLSLDVTLSAGGSTLKGSLSFTVEGNTMIDGKGSLGTGVARLPLKFDTLTKV
ncbi:MAG: hypothetical protein HQ559_00065 [Lentisphaerae bacterium]|nr:hypothetical protein [Lentisphaerota bacterium]